jgi:hypothetical protein
VKKFLRKKTGKKEILRNPGRNVFLRSKKRNSENMNRQPSQQDSDGSWPKVTVRKKFEILKHRNAL